MARRIAGSAARTISAEDAAGLVKSGMWLDYCGLLSQPDVFDKALAARADELENVHIRSCLTLRPRAILDADPQGRHFHWVSLHFSGYDRSKHDVGLCEYLPVNLGEIPDYYRRFIDPVDIVILKTCRIDADGYFNLSGNNLWHLAVIERARLVIVEVTDGLPFVHGDENWIHISEVDYIIEGDNQPPPELLESCRHRHRPGGGRPYRCRDRGWRLSADRHRRHAECGLFRAAAQSGSRSRHPYGNDDRWPDRSLPGRPRHQCPQIDQCRPQRLHFRAGLQEAL